MKYLVLLALTVLVAACATKPAAPSFNGLLLAAGTLDDTAIVTADGLLNSHAISAVQAREVLDITDKLKTALDAANAANQINDAATATAKLTNASTALASLTLCLKPPITAASFDACLTALPVSTL